MNFSKSFSASSLVFPFKIEVIKDADAFDIAQPSPLNETSFTIPSSITKIYQYDHRKVDYNLQQTVLHSPSSGNFLDFYYDPESLADKVLSIPGSSEHLNDFFSPFTKTSTSSLVLYIAKDARDVAGMLNRFING